jgi:hypothetical protein
VAGAQEPKRRRPRAKTAGARKTKTAAARKWPARKDEKQPPATAIATAAAQGDIDDDLPELTLEEREAFLAYIRDQKDCSVRAAADAAGIKRKQVRDLKERDPEFAAEYRDARGYGDETIRNELRRRAIEGVAEPVFGKLGKVGERIVYSDRLLAMMAKAHLPEALPAAAPVLPDPPDG